MSHGEKFDLRGGAEAKGMNQERRKVAKVRSGPEDFTPFARKCLDTPHIDLV